MSLQWVLTGLDNEKKNWVHKVQDRLSKNASEFSTRLRPLKVDLKNKTHLYTSRRPQAPLALHSTASPLSGSEEAWRASAEVAAVRVGAAKLAGVLAGGALVDVGTAAAPLLVVEAGGAEAAEASQRVVARGPATDLAVQALVLIWGWKEEVEGKSTRGHFRLRTETITGVVRRSSCKYLDFKELMRPRVARDKMQST